MTPLQILLAETEEANDMDFEIYKFKIIRRLAPIPDKYRSKKRTSK